MFLPDLRRPRPTLPREKPGCADHDHVIGRVLRVEESARTSPAETLKADTKLELRITDLGLAMRPSCLRGHSKVVTLWSHAERGELRVARPSRTTGPALRIQASSSMPRSAEPIFAPRLLLNSTSARCRAKTWVRQTVSQRCPGHSKSCYNSFHSWYNCLQGSRDQSKLRNTCRLEEPCYSIWSASEEVAPFMHTRI